ncbi:MAG: DUF4160 domain-containing protein [Gemmatimonadaceae bacterium]
MSIPRRALRLVMEWKDLHMAERLSNWNAARMDEALRPIAGLE